MGIPGMRRVPQVALALCLVALAVNAVLIQTVMTDSSMTKNAVRAGVLGVALAGLAVNWRRLPWWPFLLIGWCGLLLVLRGNQDQLSIVFVVLLAVLAAQVSERFFLGWAALSSLLAFALIFVLLAVGLSQDDVVMVDFDQVSRARHNFGAQSIPFLFNVTFGAFALSVLYAKKYLSTSRFLIAVATSLVAATWLYRESDTRGGYATFLLFLALIAVVPRVRVAWLYALAPVVLLGATLWLSFGDVDARINRALSQRPHYFGLFFGDITTADVLLSTSVKQFPYPVDNSFLHLMVGTSIVVLALFLWLYARAVLRLMREERFAEVAFLTATIVYCASEGLLVRIENGFIIFTWYLVLQYGAGIRERSVRLDTEAESHPADVTR